MIKCKILIPPKGSYTRWEHWELCILIALILKVTISSLFRLIHTFTVMFSSPSTRVLSSVTAIAFFWVLFIWPHKFRAHLLYYSQTLVMCSVLSLGPCRHLRSDLWENIYTCYSLSQGVTCFVLSGFHNSSLISIHILFSYYYCHPQSIYV